MGPFRDFEAFDLEAVSTERAVQLVRGVCEGLDPLHHFLVGGVVGDIDIEGNPAPVALNFRPLAHFDVSRASLNAAAGRLEGKDYVRAQVDNYVATKLLPVFLARGFLKADISDPKIKVVGDTADSTQIALDFAVTPGPQYKLASIQWDGNKSFPTAKLQELVRAKPGDLANTPQLQSDLDTIHHLYGTVGYMTQSAKLTPQFDDTAHTVVYQVEIHEGDVFHLGDLDIQGLDPKATDRLREAWTLRDTDPYDTTYPKRFFEQTVKLLSRDVTWTISIHEGVNEQDKTVDVTLRYSIRPSS